MPDALSATTTRVGPENHLAPWAAYLDIRNGDTARGIALAMALREESLALTPQRARRISDLVVHRLWFSRIEFRADPDARDAAEELLDSDHRIGPYRRALLHYALGSDIVTRTPLRRLSDLDAANEHLNRALALARALEIPRLVARCQSMLALLEVPRGNLVAAEQLATDALGQASESTADVLSVPVPFWQLRAAIVLQWSRYYQGRPIDVEVLRRCSERTLIWSDPVLAAQLTTLTALAALESGDGSEARRALSRVEVDRRIAGIGLWRLPMFLVEGYLAVAHGDELRTAQIIDQLALLPAPAEAALIRTVHLTHVGRIQDALTAIAQVTSGELRALSFTYPAAMALEAALYEEAGLSAEADRSMARALGAAEPINALRVFTAHDPPHLRVLTRRAAAAAPQNRWIRTVNAYLDGRLRDQGAAAPRQPERESPLTPRELEVLRLVNDGASHARISSELFISLNTVKSHLSSIRRKLGVERTGQAAALARREGWL